jgi:hypothetical protein
MWNEEAELMDLLCAANQWFSVFELIVTMVFVPVMKSLFGLLFTVSQFKSL